MFLAPCTLPIVPAYLALIAGGTKRSRVVLNAFVFIIGFSLVFILLGTFAGFFGSVLGSARFGLARAGGAILIFFGLMTLGLLHPPLLSREWHARIPSFLTLGRPESSFLIGALFALGWSPCIGPVLGTILLFASQSSTALQGALLLGVFSLGLGIPFLLTALFLSHAQDLFARAGKFTVYFQYFGGVMLVGIGLLMLLGRMDLLIAWGYGLFDFVGYERLLDYL